MGWTIYKSLLLLLIAIAFASCKNTPPQVTLTPQASPSASLLIGLHVVSPHVVWASGTNATVIRTIDGGDTWAEWQYTEGPALQFRDIHALDAYRAVVMAAGDGPLSAIFLLDLTDSSWTKTYAMPHETGFLDAIAFWDKAKGIAYGDAVSGKPFVLLTSDGGQNWAEVAGEQLPDAGIGEGGFASSGTNIATISGGTAFIGTGAGGNARLLITKDYGTSWSVKETPMVKGDAAGITSVRFSSAQEGIIVGGDLANTDGYTDNLYFITDQGDRWAPMHKPHTAGAFYGSAYADISGWKVVLVTGPNGADISFDQGQSWKNVSTENLWSCDILPEGIGWLVGKKGAIYKLEIKD